MPFVNPVNGQEMAMHGVFRADTGEYLGQYQGKKMLPYTTLVETFETALTGAGFQFERSFIVTGNGARFYGKYDIGNGLHVGNDGFRKILRVQSSHDGVLTPGFGFEAERLACLNGMMGLAELFSIYKRHSEKFDLGFIGANITEAITSGENKTRETVEKMGNFRLNDGQARNILSNIVKMGAQRGVSPKAGHLIHHNWQNPSNDEKPLGDTLYRLYNAATRFTRDVANKGRFELSRRGNLFVTGAFDLAVNRASDMEKLLANPAEPLDFDAVEVLN